MPGAHSITYVAPPEPSDFSIPWQARSPVTITVEGEQAIQSRTLIIATGASAIHLGLPNEAKLTGHGVSTCATCDGCFSRGKELLVVAIGHSPVQ